MTKNERYKINCMFIDEFKKIKNPTAEQCLLWIISYPRFIRVNQLKHIPEEHRNFCEAQLKLEGLM